jgi:hypothetical protein
MPRKVALVLASLGAALLTATGCWGEKPAAVSSEPDVVDASPGESDGGPGTPSEDARASAWDAPTESEGVDARTITDAADDVADAKALPDASSSATLIIHGTHYFGDLGSSTIHAVLLDTSVTPNVVRASGTAPIANGAFTLVFDDAINAGVHYGLFLYSDTNENGICDATDTSSDAVWEVTILPTQPPYTVDVSPTTSLKADCSHF